MLDADQLRALLRACESKTLRDRRDEALVRLLVETGLRAGEAIALTVDDVDLTAGTVTIRRGKGGRGRIAAFSSRALDRYLRLRIGARRPPRWIVVGVGVPR